MPDHRMLRYLNLNKTCQAFAHISEKYFYKCILLQIRLLNKYGNQLLKNLVIT